MMTELSIIIPAYNEENVIGNLVNEIQIKLQNTYQPNQYEILVVDDGSNDKTSKLAKKAGAKVLRHPYNIGNGAAVKKGMRNAKGKMILLMDGDGQHNPEYIPKLIELSKQYDMVIGSRLSWKGTSWHRTIANIFFNKFSSWLINRKIIDLTSGFRIINTSIAKRFIFLLPNTFSYPSTLTMSLSRAGYTIAYLPIQLKKRCSKSKINLLADGMRFLTIMMKIAVFFNPLRVFIPISLFCFAGGAGHAIYKIIIRGEQYTGFTIFLITTSLLIFLLGLISEQITQLRFERNEEQNERS
jgi:glycosyltransferase involved in cell wall biosynthesis